MRRHKKSIPLIMLPRFEMGSRIRWWAGS